MNDLPELEPCSKPVQQQLDEIMDNFDFQKVMRVMRFLRWGWCNGTGGIDKTGRIWAGMKYPTESELRETARELLMSAIDSKAVGAASGGFVADYHEGCLSLHFAVESWDGC